MIRRILVPLDGSALAESILPCVREFAILTGASLILMQAIEPRPPFREAAASAASEYLASVADMLHDEGLDARTEVVTGAPVDAIIQRASETDLIAMATHGRSGIGRWVYGSVTDAVLRASPVPVLLVRVSQDQVVVTGYPRRVLAPLDGSELAERALPLAAMLARGAGAEIILTTSVHVTAEALTGEPEGEFDYPAIGDLATQARESAVAYLRQAARHPALRDLSTNVDAREAAAAEGILEAADAWEADLIVMSTHGRSGLGRWMYGSVAEKVLAEATVPVLLARAGVPLERTVTVETPIVEQPLASEPALLGD